MRTQRLLHGLSESNDVDVVREATEVVRIGREHSGATISCSHGHGSVDDATGVGHPADLPRGSGVVVVTGTYLAERRSETPGRPGLRAVISAGVGHHARRVSSHPPGCECGLEVGSRCRRDRARHEM